MINIEEIKKEIIERLQTLNPEKIILFGSYAWGIPDENSDLDLYVVTGDERIPLNYAEKREIVRRVSSLIQDLRRKLPIDLLVHTKKMSEKFFLLNSSFSREILEKGMLIYGKRASR